LLGAGVVVAFQANQLPNPLVEISVPGQPAYQVSARQTLKPHFPAAEPARFRRIAADTVVTVRLYDDKAGRKKQLLGEAQLPCRHLQVSTFQLHVSYMSLCCLLQATCSGCILVTWSTILPTHSTMANSMCSITVSSAIFVRHWQ
jgi:hypothetical protein